MGNAEVVGRVGLATILQIPASPRASVSLPTACSWGEESPSPPFQNNLYTFRMTGVGCFNCVPGVPPLHTKSSYASRLALELTSSFLRFPVTSSTTHATETLRLSWHN